MIIKKAQKVKYNKKKYKKDKIIIGLMQNITSYLENNFR